MDGVTLLGKSCYGRGKMSPILLAHGYMILSLSMFFIYPSHSSGSHHVVHTREQPTRLYRYTTWRHFILSLSQACILALYDAWSAVWVINESPCRGCLHEFHDCRNLGDRDHYERALSSIVTAKRQKQGWHGIAYHFCLILTSMQHKVYCQ